MIGRPSLDGRLFPYIDPHNNVAVWEVRTDRSRLVAEAHAGEAGIAPVLSPDGGRVAYGWSLPNGDHELRISGIDGTFRRTVTTRQAGHVPLPVDWSRDGRHLLCWLRGDTGTADLVLVPVDGGQPQWLHTSEHWPSAQLSPDGRFVLVPRVGTEHASGDLLIIGTDGSTPRPLVASKGNPRFPTWRPDGRGVFFVRDSPTLEASADGWIVDVNEGRVHGDERLVAENLGGVFPASFPVTASLPVALTDDRSVYRIHMTFSTEAYVAPIDLTGASTPGPPTRIAPTEVGFHGGPSWSPDQKSIAYFSTRPGEVAGVLDERTLTIRETSSGTGRRLAVPLEFIGGYFPRWAPDSKTVVIWGAETARTGALGYFRVDVHTGQTTRLVVNARRRSPFFQFSPDGREFFYVDPTAGIVARDLTTGNERLVVSLGVNLEVWPFAIAPDGRSIAFRSHRADEHTLQVQPLGGTRRELVRTKDGLVFQAWTPDGRDLFYATGRSPEPAKLWRIPARGGKPRDLQFVVGSTVNPISIRGDGRMVAYAERKARADLWITQLVLEGSGEPAR
jgi:Tol biopolymer transport system component